MTATEEGTAADTAAAAAGGAPARGLEARASDPAPTPTPAPTPRKDTTARPARRGPADPVRALMHRHRELCAHAVDALEIAAGLEAHGVTDRTAARFRHRDVFSLAEELYARVPRAGADAGPRGAVGAVGAVEGTAAGRRGFSPAPSPSSPFGGGGGGWVRGWGGPCGAALQLLPGALCVATVAALASVGEEVTPPLRHAVGMAGAVLLALAVRLAVRSGPLRSRHPGAGSRTAGLWICWTAGYAVYGDWLLGQLLAGGPDLPYVHPRAAVATAVALAFAVLPAAGCARWFAVRGRRALAASRGLDELAARIRPLLLVTALLFLGALVALLLAAGAVFGAGDEAATAAAAALGLLLFLARLLTVHGFPEAAASGLASAAALEALAPALVLIARLPGVPPLDVPVEALTGAAGPAAVAAVACTAAALGLLGYGLLALTGACAHSPDTGQEKAHRP